MSGHVLNKLIWAQFTDAHKRSYVDACVYVYIFCILLNKQFDWRVLHALWYTSAFVNTYQLLRHLSGLNLIMKLLNVNKILLKRCWSSRSFNTYFTVCREELMEFT